MISYINSTGEMTMECDGAGCYEVLEVCGEWQECIQEAKEEDWQICKEGDDWVHHCPHCRSDAGQSPFDKIG